MPFTSCLAHRLTAATNAVSCLLALRDWDATFNETDFKITDGLERSQRFKSLTIRKTVEIVAYGLPGELAPSLKRNKAKHVEATNYHKMMEASDTVIIDVRNAYESAIGHFQVQQCCNCLATLWSTTPPVLFLAPILPFRALILGCLQLRGAFFCFFAQPPPGGAELIDPKMRNSHEVGCDKMHLRMA